MSTESSPMPQRQCRVILAGRTGLDSELRFDPRLELVRVRSALEAIGELSDPIDESSPSQSVVVVGPDADPSDRLSFIDALRRIDPSVRVLRASPRFAPQPSTDPSPYEADVAHGRAAAMILNGEHKAAPTVEIPSPSPSQETAASNEPPIDTPAESSAPDDPPARRVDEAPPAPVASGDHGDGMLVQQLLGGRDPVGAAVDLIRARTGVRDVRFEPGPGEGGCVVIRRGVTLGRLISDSQPDADFASSAEWLAGWIMLRDQQQQLRMAALTDPLTGAWNRRYLDRFLSGSLKRAQAKRWPVTVMVFDIDDFKTFNDEFSHAAGDEILIHTVKLLKSVIRPEDKVCRIGGDEFVVVFNEPEGPRQPNSAPPSSVFEIAKRFQRQICEHRFPKLGDQAPGTLTISGGLATFPWDGRTPEELIAAADELSLQSKRQGKNALTLGPGAARICELDG